jgi:hypothetical protein
MVLVLKPSAEQRTSLSDPAAASHMVTFGEQIWLRHEGTPAVTMQLWAVLQVAVMLTPPPFALQVTTMLF